MSRTLSILFALAAPLIFCSTAFAGQSFGGATMDVRGNTYALDMDGNIAVLGGSDKRALISISGMAMDVAVIADELVVPVRDHSMNGVLEVYSAKGERIRSTTLGARLWPQRVAAFGDSIAVLVTSPEMGTFVEFVDADFKPNPEARVYTPIECEALGWFDMAVGVDGIYVAPLQQCREGYLVRKFGSDGAMLAEFSGSLKHPSDRQVTDEAGRVGTTFTLAVKDVFVTSEYLAVVLGLPSENGMSVDLWTPDGKFVDRVTVPGLFSPIVRGFSDANGLQLIGIEDDEVIRRDFQLPDLAPGAGVR